MLTGCGNRSELQHCVTIPRDAPASFSPEDEERIFTTFNIIVPKNETEAYVRSLSRRISDYVGEWHTVTFTVEIGGVKDYDTFYAANTGRVDDNGEKGKSMNEFLTNGSDFYITYQELLFDDPQFLEEENNQALYDSFNDLYESIAG